MSSRIPPFVDFFPEDGLGPPFEPGGVGLRFLYFSNRNKVSHLLAEHRDGLEFSRVIVNKEPMGYATLFWLRKLEAYAQSRPGIASPYRENVAVRLDTEGKSYAVVHDPRRTSIGGPNLIHPIETLSEAKETARAITAQSGCPTVVALIDEIMSWH